MAKRKVKKPDLPEIELTTEEKVARVLIYFVQGLLFAIVSTVVLAILYFLGIFSF